MVQSAGTSRILTLGGFAVLTLLTYSFAMLFAVCVIYAMIADFTQLRIPNVAMIVLAAAFVPYALLVGVAHPWLHLADAAGIFILFFGFFALGWIGAGDVKFAAAVMLWTEPETGMRFVLIFSILGGLFGLGLLILRRTIVYSPWLTELPVVGRFARWARTHACPYGLPIGLAALWVAPRIFHL